MDEDTRADAARSERDVDPCMQCQMEGTVMNVETQKQPAQSNMTAKIRRRRDRQIMDHDVAHPVPGDDVDVGRRNET